MGQSPSSETYNDLRDGLPLIQGAADLGAYTPKPQRFTSAPTKVSAPGDTLISVRAPVGLANWANGQFCLGRGVAALRARAGINEKFLYYLTYLMNEHWQQQATGTTFPGIGGDTIRNTPIVIPPLREQREIASILGALDDKIELNRRMNATIEGMARALFQSWFVDFDPVRAKAEGRQPVGMDAETAALFPDSFEDSALGPIPKGWSAGNMGNVTQSRRERVGSEDAQVLSAVTTGKLINSAEYFNKQVFSASIINYLVVRQWDFAYNPSRINIGSIGLLEADVIGAVSPVYEVFTPSRSLHWFVEKSLRLPFVQDQIKVLCSGSVRQSLKPRDFASIQIVIPSLEVVHAYNRLWELQRSKILSLGNENSVLVSVRDALLPKLLSGELRVGDVAA